MSKLREAFSARLLSDGELQTASDQTLRVATGVGLSAIYGLALGARDGGMSFATHAVGVPAAMVAVAVLGAPAFTIALSLADSPVDVRSVTHATVKALSTAGLVLAGLAPAAALYVVMADGAGAAAVMPFGGLLLAGWLGLRSFLVSVRDSLSGAALHQKLLGFAVASMFALFAIVLALRVWFRTLALLGGVS